MNFNEALKRCRKLRKATQKQVAQAVGVSETMYQYYEYGKNEPTVGVLIALAKYFNVSLDYLCGLSDEP
uniref:Helix-turn-helix domain protein n=1 Tax=Siphoviridae sp. ctDmR33 TaxID=2825389 RepID=A0A8S5UX64_9CAUD|nr:MAG TPA: helix-turn-helix domain protein [Siphoviridae sp. ctDmR33]